MPIWLADIETRVEALAARLRRDGHRLATAESCTGGLIAAARNPLAGSRARFARGLVTHSKEAKAEFPGGECRAEPRPRDTLL